MQAALANGRTEKLEEAMKTEGQTFCGRYCVEGRCLSLFPEQNVQRSLQTNISDADYMTRIHV